MDDQLETGKKTTKADEEFVAPDNSEQTSQPEQVEQTDQPEFELTPKIEAEIMDKVQDINEIGVGYSSVTDYSNDCKKFNLDKINKTLDHGLLGSFGNRRVRPDFAKTDDWMNRFRQREVAWTFFNIVGRTFGPIDDRKISSNINTGWGSGNHNSINFLIDLSKFEEIAPGSSRMKRAKPMTYFSQDDLGTGWSEGMTREKYREKQKDNPNFQEYLEKGYFTKDGDFTRVHSDRGFMAPRIPRRCLTGIAIGKSEELTDPLKIAEDLKEPVEEIIKLQIELYKKNSRLMLPIYDTIGNLLWPKQMSYEEVKEFVTKREEAKGEEEEEPDSSLRSE